MQAAWFLSSNLWLLPASIGKFYIFVVFRRVLMGFVASAMVSALFRFPDISDCAWHSMHPTSFEGRSSRLICVAFCITTPNLRLYHLAPLRLVSGPQHFGQSPYTIQCFYGASFPPGLYDFAVTNTRFFDPP